MQIATGQPHWALDRSPGTQLADLEPLQTKPTPPAAHRQNGEMPLLWPPSILCLIYTMLFCFFFSWRLSSVSSLHVGYLDGNKHVCGRSVA